MPIVGTELKLVDEGTVDLTLVDFNAGGRLIKLYSECRHHLILESTAKSKVTLVSAVKQSG